MSTHFTAVVEVTKTEHTPEQPGGGSGYRHIEPKPEKRDVGQIAHIVIRSETLDGLREKLAAHVALIDE